jgi:preprotein translocase subunit SecD
MRVVIAEAAATDASAPFATVRCTATGTVPVPASDRQAVVCRQGAATATSAATKLLVGPAALGNSDIASVQLGPPPPGSGGAAWHIDLTLTERGGQAFQHLTAAAACRPAYDVGRQIAIVVDGIAIEDPMLDNSIRCGQGLEGQAGVDVNTLTEREARLLFAVLANKPLPFHLEPQPPPP